MSSPLFSALVASSSLVGSALAAGGACAPASPWTLVASGYTKVSFDGTNVCVVNTSKNALCGSIQPSSWTSLSSSASDVVVGGGDIFWTNWGIPVAATSTALDTYWNSLQNDWLPNNKWGRQATDGTNYCVLVQSPLQFVACAKTSEYTARTTSSLVTDLALFGDILYLVDTAGILYYASITTTIFKKWTSWTTIPGITLNQIAFDGKTVCGINADKAIVCSTAASTLPTTLMWSAPITHTNPWTALSISNGVLYAIDNTTALYIAPLSALL